MSVVDQPSSGGFTRRQGWGLFWLLLAALLAWLVFAVWPDWLNAMLISKKAFVSAVLNVNVRLDGLSTLPLLSVARTRSVYWPSAGKLAAGNP